MLCVCRIVPAADHRRRNAAAKRPYRSARQFSDGDGAQPSSKLVKGGYWAESNNQSVREQDVRRKPGLAPELGVHCCAIIAVRADPSLTTRMAADSFKKLRAVNRVSLKTICGGNLDRSNRIANALGDDVRTFRRMCSSRRRASRASSNYCGRAGELIAQTNWLRKRRAADRRNRESLAFDNQSHFICVSAASPAFTFFSLFFSPRTVSEGK